MVSDVVLSRELPASINDSVDAYISCISGAITKDEYLKTVSGAGFREIGIVSETSVPVDEWINDPIAESVIKKLKISHDQAREILGSVISVTVKGVK